MPEANELPEIENVYNKQNAASNDANQQYVRDLERVNSELNKELKKFKEEIEAKKHEDTVSKELESEIQKN